MRHKIMNYPITLFYLLTFLWSWLFWIPGVIYYNVQNLDTLPVWVLVVGIAGTYGPTVAALLVTYLVDGKIGLKQLVGRLQIWRVASVWYAFIFLFMPVLFLISIVLYQGNTGTFDPVPALLYIPLVWLAALPFGPLGEESGWRGFAQVRLQTHHNVIVSACIVGILWGIWHLPLFWFPGAALAIADTGQLTPMILYMINIVMLSIVYAIVFQKTRGSVFIAILFHMFINSTGGIILPMFVDMPDVALDHIGYIQLILMAVVTGGLTIRFWRDLSQTFTPVTVN